MSEKHVTDNEFWRGMDLLRSDLKGIHERLDAMNGRTRRNEQAIAVLESRDASTKDPAARWTGVGAGIGALIAGLLGWFK